jgi:hypothetical protein
MMGLYGCRFVGWKRGVNRSMRKSIEIMGAVGLRNNACRNAVLSWPPRVKQSSQRTSAIISHAHTRYALQVGTRSSPCFFACSHAALPPPDRSTPHAPLDSGPVYLSAVWARFW